MTTAFFTQPASSFVGPADGEVLVGRLDNLADAYVIFAKCVAADEAGPVDGIEVLRVQFRLVYGAVQDTSWCYLVKGPSHPDPIDTVTLNLAASRSPTYQVGAKANASRAELCPAPLPIV